MSRLASEFWVKAYIKRLSLTNIPAYVLYRGDDTAGSIVIKVATLDGRAVLYEQVYDIMTDTRQWSAVLSDTETEVDAWIARQRSRDSDLWAIEIESPTGAHYLDGI
jgi:hypothetical protein